VDGYATPEEAALKTMPTGITHVVGTVASTDEEFVYVLLAVEVSPKGFYLDENLCARCADGSWQTDAGAGGGFSDRTLADLRAAPPPPGLGFPPRR
jgi:hypothetical protein